ncbi:hypothetical protein HY250_02410 [Candidatus Azambacteria bacterium]|nr:hypothetical protein [Candidatus Azambacteria bacterium]
MIDLVRADNGKERSILLGRKLRERIGLALWRLSRCIAAIEKTHVEVHIACVVQGTVPRGYYTGTRNNGAVQDIQEIAKKILSNMDEVNLLVDVGIKKAEANSLSAIEKVKEALMELHLLCLANIPFKAFSKIAFGVKGRVY